MVLRSGRELDCPRRAALQPAALDGGWVAVVSSSVFDQAGRDIADQLRELNRVAGTL